MDKEGKQKAKKIIIKDIVTETGCYATLVL